jgi:hypothetical protein
VTRLESGASLWGRFQGITGINVQLASTGESGAGQGFNDLPSPAHTVAAIDDCEWRVEAVGGHVYFRAVTVTTR